MVEDADTPTVVLYENGDLVFLKNKHRHLAYRHRRLHGAELEALKARLAAVAALGDLRPRYDVAPGATDMPEALLYVRAGDREVATRIYGLMAEPQLSPELTRRPGWRPDPLPPAIVELHRFLAGVHRMDGPLWKPRYLEAIVWPYHEPRDPPIRWPAGWPVQRSRRGADLDGDTYSIYLDGALEAEVTALLARRKENGGVEIDGELWMVEVNPAFPGEPVWRAAFDRLKPHDTDDQGP